MVSSETSPVAQQVQPNTWLSGTLHLSKKSKRPKTNRLNKQPKVKKKSQCSAVYANQPPPSFPLDAGRYGAALLT